MKFIKSLSLIIFFLGYLTQALAQNRCGTDEYYEEFLKNNTNERQNQEEFLKKCTEITTKAKNGHYDNLEKKGTVYYIPVVFHIIHEYGEELITKEQIDDQIRILNEDFRRTNADRINTRSTFAAKAADCEIEFRLATKDPNGNCFQGITRTVSDLTNDTRDQVKDLIYWNPNKYLNIWIVKSVSSQDQFTTLGFAVFPWDNTSKRGIVMRADYTGSIGTSNVNNAGRTLTHEVGHCLGLLHPFQNGCGSSAQCESTGDRICDTPPVSSASFGCNQNKNSCSNDFPNLPDQIENYMDYADGNCMNMFTKEQSIRMREVITTYSWATSLVSNANSTATGIFSNCSPKPIADFFIPNNLKTVCVGQTLTLENLSYNADNFSTEWIIEDASESIITTKNASFSFNSPGQKKVTLKVTNAEGSSTKVIEQAINVLPAISDIKLPNTEKFESFDTENKYTVVNNYSTFGWRPINIGYDDNKGIVCVNNGNTQDDYEFELYSQPYDLSSVPEPKLSFRHAYARRVSNAVELLSVWISTDCGQNYSLLGAYNSNATLKSRDEIIAGFSPNSTGDWAKKTINISANFSQSKNATFLFRFRSAQGSNLYLDDIHLGNYSLSINEAKLSTLIKIYPQPAKESVIIDWKSLNEKVEIINLFNADGKIVNTISDIKAQTNYELRSLQPGIYFIKIETSENQITKKIIIQ